MNRVGAARWWRAAGAAVCVVAALAACSDGGTQPATSTQEWQSACHADGDREVTVPGPDGARTFAVGVGTGPRAVLLLHEAEQNHCTWIDFARTLAARGGFQVWAVDSSASSASHSVGTSDPRPDLVRMAEYVRAHGATEVAVAGASMGGSAAMAVAGPIKAVRVATLSAPDIYQGADAAGGAKALTVPGFVIVGQTDTDFVPAAQEFARSNPAHIRLLVVPTGAHGTSLLARDAADPGGPTVADLLIRFLEG